MTIIGRLLALVAVLFVTACATKAPMRRPPSGYLLGAEAPRQDDDLSDVLAEDATLDDYLRYAALHNPGLRAAYYEWMGSLERVPQAQALPDPRLSYGYYFQEVETRVGSQRQRLGASQMFPWFGKLALRGDVASQAAEAAHERFEAGKLKLFYRVEDAYAEYYYLARAIDVTRENVELMTYWEKLTRARYRVATGRYPDVIKAQVELGKLDDRLRSLEDLRTPIAARLNDALNRASTAPLPWPTDLPVENAIFADDDLLAALALDNPELRALQATIAAQERSIELAGKEYFPDLTFGVQWIDTSRLSGQGVSDNGKDPIIGTVSVNLPIWWQKYSAGVREAQAGRLAAANTRADRTLQLTTRLQLALYKFRDAERKIDLYHGGLIPKAREALGATFTAYESEKADFLDLLDAQRILLDFRLSYERALADRTQRVAEIEMLVGKPLAREDSPAFGKEGDDEEESL